MCTHSDPVFTLYPIRTIQGTHFYQSIVTQGHREFDCLGLLYLIYLYFGSHTLATKHYKLTLDIEFNLQTYIWNLPPEVLQSTDQVLINLHY
jgi:hypothetical protein